MGLGAKIKEALHGDHYDKDVKAPGAYPDEEPLSGHNNGNEYVAPHSDLINKKWETTGPAGTSDQTHTGVDNTGATGRGGNLLSSSGSTRNKLHRDTDHYHATQEGSSQPTHSHHPQDSGVGLGKHASTKDGPSQHEGAYWGDLPSEAHHGHGKTHDLPDYTYRGQDQTDAGRGDQNPRFDDQGTGGGVYNPVTAGGAGGPDHPGSYGKHHTSGGAVHDPFTSSSKRTSIPQNPDNRSHGFPTSRNDHSGGGLAGAGAGAAAGYGANEYTHQGHENTGYSSTNDYSNRDNHAPGLPHSSMLDPEPSLPSSAVHQGHQATGTYSPTQHNPGNTSSVASGTGLGKDHYGPAHEGAKVLHTCQHCGRDNDISQYFKKEAVYRLGS